jgi:predicted nucleic acid-binding protein
MREIAKALREAYKLIQEADKTDIDAFYLAVEEAQGFIAEALDLAEEEV